MSAYRCRTRGLREQFAQLLLDPWPACSAVQALHVVDVRVGSGRALVTPDRTVRDIDAAMPGTARMNR